MTKTVTFTISPKGQMTVKTKGYAGADCRRASAIFEELGTVISDTPTEEMYDMAQGQCLETNYLEEE